VMPMVMVLLISLMLILITMVFPMTLRAMQTLTEMASRIIWIPTLMATASVMRLKPEPVLLHQQILMVMAYLTSLIWIQMAMVLMITLSLLVTPMVMA